MCGIVGYIGKRDTQDYLLSGLRRLEYRGYDSAGIVTVGARDHTLLRSVGKVRDLEQLVAANRTNDSVGIGHTRWATHGMPSVANAHPHGAGDIFLVHNGIIENYKELKAELPDVLFEGETDSEVLAALIDSLYDEKTPLLDAVAGALRLVRGTYGIAVVSKREPGVMIVARLGSPILIGIGEDETYVASDASALIGYTSRVIYLQDGEIAICHAGEVVVHDAALQPVPHTVETIEAEMEAIQKNNYDHFLLKEIHDQPASLRATLNGRIDSDTARLGGLNMTDDELRAVSHVIIVGCGTAYYAGLMASYLAEELLQDVTIEVVVASEYRYRTGATPPGSVALIVSQSGETADTLACLRELKRRGVRTLGIINVVGSTIAREVDGGIYVHAGPEISVASTKAFTCQVSAMLLFALTVNRVKGGDQGVTAAVTRELAALPDEIARVIDEAGDDITKQAATHFETYDHALYLGRGSCYPVALEGALKLKEISYVHSEGYPLGELKHGPIALVDDRFFEVILLHRDRLLEKSLSGLAEVNARAGHVLAITDSTDAVDAEYTIRVTTVLERLAPLVLNVVLQLFAYHVAIQKGNDVDQPRNLAKSVTVE